MLRSLITNFASHCGERSFFGIPSWDRYLTGHIEHKTYHAGTPREFEICEFTGSFVENGRLNLEVAALLGLGILDILLRLAALIAVAFVIYGGIQYVLSQGEPDRAKKATGTILNALIGLGITIMAVAVVSFIGNAVR